MSDEKAVTKTKKKNAAARFFGGVVAEFKKIIWPDRDTLLREFLVVAITTVITGLIIALVDYGANYLFDFLLKLGA
ncbi:MAG: preprotein translocase subunit SecE [Lachnospiraceae bacterium]|jgi:preprotein translocase subunit SecE